MEIFHDCVSIFVGLYTVLVLLALFFSSFHFLRLSVGFSGSDGQWCDLIAAVF